MAVSRRRFLGVAAAIPWAVRDGLTLAPIAGAAPRPISSRLQSRVLADFEGDCALTESLAGFERGLTVISVGFHRVTPDALSSTPAADVILVPGAVLRSARTAEMLRRFADRGATVVYESGAAYADSEAFASEQRLLARYFGLRIDTPVELWRAKPASGLPPYVYYDWPSRVIVRDFSRACPVRCTGPVRPAATSIASFGGVPVACRESVGRGSFIYLGSAFGPHVKAGDPEALELLRAFVAGS